MSLKRPNQMCIRDRVRIEQQSRHITLAYFDKKSTVDYIGVVQGIPVCFDAKECRTDSFPLQNIHGHQEMCIRDRCWLWFR